MATMKRRTIDVYRINELRLENIYNKNKTEQKRVYAEIVQM
jgi:hypothetical protein